MIIFADEFLFFNHAVLPAMLPTLATGAAFIMTSSVSPDGDNPLLKLLSAKYPDGTDVVENLNWIQSCMPCQRRGLQDRCTHIAREPQHFQSHAGHERLMCLMSQNRESYDREMLNIGGLPTIRSAFETQWIDHIVQNTYQCDKTIDRIFITIDPSAGMRARAFSSPTHRLAKDRNLYVVLSTVFVDGHCIVCHHHSGTAPH